MKKKGITLLVLVITIVVSLILLSVIIPSVGNIMQDAEKRSFAKELFMVRQAVLDYEFENGSYPVKEEINLNINGLETEGQKQFEKEPNYSSKNILLKKIDLFKANIDRTNLGNKQFGEDDYFAFSTSTKNIYYIKGEIFGDDIYYTLTDELYSLIKIRSVK